MTTQATDWSERRKHPRVALNSEIEVSGDKKIPALLNDLSVGGASFRTPFEVGRAGDFIVLTIPFADGAEPINLMARIVRSDQQMTAVEFATMERREEMRLARIIARIVSTTKEVTREHARVQRRMKLRYGSHQRMTAILRDISRGGLSMRTCDRLKVGDGFDIVVPDMSGVDCLHLKARVVHLRLLWEGEREVFHVGVEFYGLTPMTRLTLSVLVAQYARGDASVPSTLSPATEEWGDVPTKITRHRNLS